MNIISKAVKELETKIYGSGCDDGVVTFSKVQKPEKCQYLNGECIKASYGGKHVEIATSYPLELKTKVSFMYGQPLDSPVQRTAACAILNVLSYFMCFSRTARACGKDSHDACLKELKEIIGDKKVFLNGFTPEISNIVSENIAACPEDADIILVSGEGLFDDEKLNITEEFLTKKRVIFTGPETSGICTIENHEYFCPYARKK
ncbi:hypothetical protein L1994_08280 [Methanomicrobium antiquum]|uniref:Uncharacterized protein n=1 Tax=Methanomicrobium antiquum TaxID=487686 RepID=A0AAF0FUH6_9EURY|nr:hypothetical protein [Methanomicrobium antiquum]MDD3976785.1 hypothetical protein [Methanomicrobium sp.]WFN36140.1 hypothetical protein L1994_08280 [Methanomicrobium antiquum]